MCCPRSQGRCCRACPTSTAASTRRAAPAPATRRFLKAASRLTCTAGAEPRCSPAADVRSCGGPPEAARTDARAAAGAPRHQAGEYPDQPGRRGQDRRLWHQRVCGQHAGRGARPLARQPPSATPTLDVLRPCAPWTVAWPAAGVSMRNHVACTGCPGAPALQAPCSRLSGGLAARAVPHVPGHRDLHVARAHQLGAVLVPGRHLARPRPRPGGRGARRDAVLPVVHMTAQRSCPGTWRGPAWRRCWPGDARPAARRSLGLTLLECATGRYPYDASGGPLQLMIQARRARIDGLICWLPGELPLLRRAAALRSDAPQTLRPPSTSLAAKLGAADAPRAPRRMQCLASQFQWPWSRIGDEQVLERV